MSTPTPSKPFPPSAERAQLERLQARLSDRASTVHFAHSGVSTVAAVIFAGAAGKLFWDAHHHFPIWGILVSLLSAGLFFYASAHYRFGKRELKEELQLLQTLRSLRERLRLDDPASLLPQGQ